MSETVVLSQDDHDMIKDGLQAIADGAPSLRDLFAAHALQGILAAEEDNRELGIPEACKYAFRYADAMMAERTEGL